MGKIYISGPITGHDDYMEKFECAEKALRAAGFYDIVNPAKVCSPLNPKTTSYGHYMELSIAMLHWCDAIFMLEGWNKSQGAKIEHRIAESRDMIILYEERFVAPADQQENADTSDFMMNVCGA